MGVVLVDRAMGCNSKRRSSSWHEYNRTSDYGCLMVPLQPLEAAVEAIDHHQ